MNDPIPSVTEYQYTEGDLEILEACIKKNPHSLMSGLSVFLSVTHKTPPVHEVLELWGRFAEKMAKGIDVVKELRMQVESGYGYTKTPRE